MGRFEAGDKHFCVKATFNFGRISAFKKELDSFFEISRGRFDRFSLTGYVKFRAERNIARVFLFDDRGVASFVPPPIPSHN